MDCYGKTGEQSVIMKNLSNCVKLGLLKQTLVCLPDLIHLRNVAFDSRALRAVHSLDPVSCKSFESLLNRLWLETG